MAGWRMAIGGMMTGLLLCSPPVSAAPQSNEPATPADPEVAKLQSQLSGSTRRDPIEQWLGVRRDHFALMAALPAAARQALAEQAPELMPVVYQDAELQWGDLNCDWKPDFAVLAFDKTHWLVSLLLGNEPPTAAAIEAKVRAESHGDALHQRRSELPDPFHMFIDVPTVLLLGLSDADGYRINHDQRASYFHMVGSVRTDASKMGGCSQLPNRDFPLDDLKWAMEHPCETLYVGCCEKDGFELRWDRASKEMVGFGGC